MGNGLLDRRLPLLHRVLLGGSRPVRRWIVLVQHEAQWVRSSLATAYKLVILPGRVHDLHATEPGRLSGSFPGRGCAGSDSAGSL